MNKALVLGLLTIVIGGFLFVLYSPGSPEAEIIQEQQNFAEAQIGELRFRYRVSPDEYQLITHDPVSQDNIVSSVSIVNAQEYQRVVQSATPTEYPPMIRLLQVGNPSALTPVEWARKYPEYSNGESLGSDNTASDLVVELAGVSGITYSGEGLYRYEYYILPHNENLYVVSGWYYEKDDNYHAEFELLKASLQFIDQRSDA